MELTESTGSGDADTGPRGLKLCRGRAEAGCHPPDVCAKSAAMSSDSLGQQGRAGWAALPCKPMPEGRGLRRGRLVPERGLSEVSGGAEYLIGKPSFTCPCVHFHPVV